MRPTSRPVILRNLYLKGMSFIEADVNALLNSEMSVSIFYNNYGNFRDSTSTVLLSANLFLDEKTRRITINERGHLLTAVG